MPKYKNLRNGPIELRTKTLDLDKLPKSDQHIFKALQYQMRAHIYQETINVFLNILTGGFNHFSCIQGKFPHPLNGCWTQEIKEK